MTRSQEKEGVERRDQRAEHERNVEQQLQRDGGADNLGEITRDDRHLARKPQRQIDGPGVMIAACLREVAPRRDAEPDSQCLQQDRHEVRQEDHREQRVAETRAAGNVRRPIARVHVTDRDHVARAGEREESPEPTATDRHSHRRVDLRQTRAQIVLSSIFVHGARVAHRHGLR